MELQLRQTYWSYLNKNSHHYWKAQQNLATSEVHP